MLQGNSYQQGNDLWDSLSPGDVWPMTVRVSVSSVHDRPAFGLGEIGCLRRSVRWCWVAASEGQTCQSLHYCSVVATYLCCENTNENKIIPFNLFNFPPWKCINWITDKGPETLWYAKDCIFIGYKHPTFYTFNGKMTWNGVVKGPQKECIWRRCLFSTGWM